MSRTWRISPSKAGGLGPGFSPKLRLVKYDSKFRHNVIYCVHVSISVHKAAWFSFFWSITQTIARFRSIDLLHIIFCTRSSNSSTALCPLCELRWIISFPRVRRSTRSQRVPADPWLVQTLNKQLAFICLQQIIINLGHPTAQRVVWKPSFIFIQQQLFHLCSKVPWLKQEKTLQFQNEPPKKNEERPFESSFTWIPSLSP